jgi:glutathione S-transferase
MMSDVLTLVSHLLCPYVQRAAIVLQEKAIPFERRDIDLSNKPDWFLKASPLGKTPVLLVGEQLDETREPKLHPTSPLARAQHRAWMEFGADLSKLIASFYTAPDEPALAMNAQKIRQRFEQLETVLGDGPYFSGAKFTIVDAVFGPVFRYFDVFETIGEFGFFDGLQKVTQWRTALAERPSIRNAVRADYPVRLRAFLLARKSALSHRMSNTATT